MSVVSQRFSRIPNARGTPARENNAVSLGSAIGARGLPPQLYSRLCKPLTCSDATRPGAHDLLRGLLRLTECSHHVGSSGLQNSGHRARVVSHVCCFATVFAQLERWVCNAT